MQVGLLALRQSFLLDGLGALGAPIYRYILFLAKH
jgi:hypothetical protein